MASLEEIKKDRLKKLEILQAAGYRPYANNCRLTETWQSFLTNFKKRLDGNEEVVLVGRIMAKRGQGGLLFVDIDDGSAKGQVILKKDNLTDKQFDLFEQAIDIGDVIEVTGYAFLTKTGQSSLEAKAWNILVKSLQPLPNKWSGLKDEETRLRKRYLDILTNPELKDLFIKKSLFWKTIRLFLEEKGFMAVETPTLELTTGGAEARPFKTYHNDFDIDLYLRISVGELWQKRLIAAGYPRTYEIGKVYRNEGSSPDHLQEFTNMEFYAAYLNFTVGQEMIKELYRTIAQTVFGRTSFETRGYKFDLADDWEELDYVSTILSMTGINVLEVTENDLRAKLKELQVEYEGDNRERMTDSLWKYCRKQISGPAFLVNHPKIVAPLSSLSEDDSRLTKTFQVILAGSELGRAHAELNDPQEQARRFEEQAKLLQAGDEEAMMPDWDYVQMLEHGMPPTFGFGVGERLFAFLADKTLREATLFPLVRPE
ncbi:MAG: lysine--tRNA ligase [Patescibacteria group bacterium]